MEMPLKSRKIQPIPEQVIERQKPVRWGQTRILGSAPDSLCLFSHTEQKRLRLAAPAFPLPAPGMEGIASLLHQVLFHFASGITQR